MSQHGRAARYLMVLATAALFGWGLPSVISAADGESGTREAPHRAGVAADIGDGWVLAVEAVSLRPSPASGASATDQFVLTAILQVGNVSSQARYFPTDRLQLMNTSGRSARPTLCETTTNPLVLSDRTPPSGIESGSACWLLNAVDVSNATIYVDPPPGEQGRPVVFFALPPLATVEAGTVPNATPSPLPVQADTPPRAAASANRTGPALDPSSCAVVYNAWARASGAYLSPACPVTNGTVLGTSVGLPNLRASPCQLYPSAAQPTTSGLGYGSGQPSSAPASGQPTVVPAQPTVAPIQGPASGMAC